MISQKVCLFLKKVVFQFFLKKEPVFHWGLLNFASLLGSIPVADFPFQCEVDVWDPNSPVAWIAIWKHIFFHNK